MVPGLHVRAAAEEASCDNLFERISKSGELPVITIDAAKQIIHVRLPGQQCSEPIDVWTTRERKAPAPKAASPDPRQAGGDTTKPPAPLQTHPMFKERAAPAKPETEKVQADTEKRAPGSACTRQLEEFWTWGSHLVEGVRYQLVEVFTIDLNGDGTTDNVGFKLTAPSMPDRVVRYIGAPGALSARSLPSLRLADDGVIADLCFGKVALEEPKSAPVTKKQPRKLFEPVDLAKEMKEKQERAKSVANGTSKDPLIRWLTYAGIGLFLILAGAVGFIMLQRWRAGKSEDGDNEDEDERDGMMDEDEVDDRG